MVGSRCRGDGGPRRRLRRPPRPPRRSGCASSAARARGQRPRRQRQRDGAHGGDGRDEAEQDARRAVQQAGGEAEAAEREEADVGQARQQEEGDGPPRDEGRRQAAAAQDPGAEREAAGAADGEQRVGRELRQPDLGARPPAHPPAEDAAEDEDVPRAGAQLERRGERDPRGLRAGEAVAQRAQPRHQDDQRDHGDDDRAEDQQPAPEARRRELVGERLGLDHRLQVLHGDDRPGAHAHSQTAIAGMATIETTRPSPKPPTTSRPCLLTRTKVPWKVLSNRAEAAKPAAR